MPLGAVRHQFKPRGSGASVTIDRVDGWESTEVAPGGFDSASGQVARATVEAYPGVFRFGSVWRCIDDDDNVVYAGRLLDPTSAGGRTSLSSRGWGNLTRKTSRRFTPQIRDYSQWQQLDGEPFGPKGKGYGVASAITIEATDNSIRASVQGSGSDPSSNGVIGGGRNGVVLWVPGQAIRRVAGTLTTDRAASPGNFEFAIMRTDGPDGDLSVEVPGSVMPLSTGVPDDRDFDVVLNSDADMVALVFRNADPNTQSHASHTARWHITDLRVNCLGTDDDYSASQLVRDVFGFLHIADWDVTGNGTNTLPFDMADNSVLADALDYANVLTGWRHIVIDRNDARFGLWGPWGPTFDVPEEADLSGLVSLDRFTAVRVPFTRPGGMADEVEVRANPDPFPEEPIYYDGITLDKTPHRDVAAQMGHAVIDEVSRERKGGTVSFAELQLPGTDERVSGHRAFAGCRLRLLGMDNLVLNVSSLRRTPERVEATFDDRFAPVDRMVARANLRQKRR